MSIDRNSATSLNVKFSVVFIFRIKNKTTQKNEVLFYKLSVDLEMTLIFDPGVKVTGG